MNSNDTFIDEILNDSFKENNLNNNKNETNNDNFNLKKYTLLVFSDGAHERVKNRSTFGIYITCKNKECNYYKFNETKIIKKITKDNLLFNIENNKIIYHSLFYNKTNEKCNNENCKYFATYNKNNIKYCKMHNINNLDPNIQFFNYDPTNIRAEGLGILYSLIYIKTIMIDNINCKDQILIDLNEINLDHKLIFKEYHPKQLILNKNIKITYNLIITDSEFWINVITKWCNNWIKKNIVMDKKNIDIIYYINYYLNLLLDNNIITEFKFVRGHADKFKQKNYDNKFNLFQKGNIIADKLANIAKDNTNYDIKISFE
jgi:ribonuclease HI